MSAALALPELHMPDQPPRRRGPVPRETKFRQWLTEEWAGSLEDLASLLKIKASYLGRLLRGNASPSARLGLRIEEITKGKVLLRDLVEVKNQSEPTA